jgi:hypothetical protein
MQMRSRWTLDATALTLLLGLLGIAGPVHANPVMPLHCLPTGTPDSWAVPARWTQWEVIDLDGKSTQSQVGYNDVDGDGLVSQGDELSLTAVGSGSIIEPVTHAYEITHEADTRTLIPLGQYDPQNPQGETWQSLYPDFGAEFAITAWSDANHSGIFDPGDTVSIGGVEWDVIRITFDAIGHFPGQATQESTWGRLKALFGLRR